MVAHLRRVRQLPRRGGSGTALPLPLSSRMRGPIFPTPPTPIPTFVGATLVVARLRRVRQLPRRGGSGTALPLPLSSRMRGPIFPTPPTPIPTFVGATLVVARLRRVRQLPRRGGSGTALPLPLSSRMRGPIFPTPPTPIPVFVGGQPLWLPAYVVFGNSHVGAGLKPAIPPFAIGPYLRRDAPRGRPPYPFFPRGRESIFPTPSHLSSSALPTCHSESLEESRNHRARHCYAPTASPAPSRHPRAHAPAVPAQSLPP